MIKALVLDDSAVMRRVLSKALAADPEIEVLPAAREPFEARDRILRSRPDVLTLDLELPGMDGLTFLRRLMRYRPMPVVVISSLTPPGSEIEQEARALGAVDVLFKPTGAQDFARLADELAQRVKAAAQVPVCRRGLDATAARRPGRPVRPPAKAPGLIALGASTGGTVALEEVISRFPADAPATLVVQHIPARFSRSFAEQLQRRARVEVVEATVGQVVQPGRVLVAPGDRHMVLRRVGPELRVELVDGPRINHHRPSIDALFRSVARVIGSHATAALLTGMGGDGAQGLLEIRQAGGHTVAQDEATSLVYGMPRVAAELEAADVIAPLDRIAALVLEPRR